MRIAGWARGAVVRFLAATVALTGLYVALDATLFWLFRQGATLRAAVPAGYGASKTDIAAVEQASAPREAALPPSHRLDAFDLGLRMGLAAAAAGRATWPQFDAAQRAAALRAAQALVDRGGLAQRLTGAPARAMTSRDFHDGTRLAQRIEADETGLAARIEVAAAPRHRHLFLLGMQLGVVLWSPSGSGETTADPPAEEIARHASLAGLPPRLWEPLLRTPPGGPAAGRRARYEAAVEAVREALRTGSP